jgi:hypothetical protein
MARASLRVIEKLPPEVPMQGIKINRLGLTMIVIAITLLGIALALSHIDPVRGLIAGPLKPVLIHEGFGQIKGMTISGLPVLA